MTAVPLPPVHLLTVGEYAALGEDDHGRSELMEGNLVMSPSPTPAHNIAVARLLVQIAPQLPDHLDMVPDVDIDLELAPAAQPGTVRRPDLSIVTRAGVRRAAAEESLLRASDVRVAIEILSPGSLRTDRMIKRAEYGDAGIPYYWIIDIEDPISLLPSRLTKRFGYRDAEAATVSFVTDDPFRLEIDLDRLR
ncbi:MAG: Uma2 family endonuclease [Micromonosporaceae bacterium]